MKLFFLLAFVFLLPRNSPAADIDWARVHEITMRGLDRLYSLEVIDALKAFDTVSRMAPGDPRGPFFTSIVHFYLYGLNRDETELQTFFELSEEVITVCDRLLDQNAHDVTTKFYLGGIYGYRGLAYQASGSILKAVRDGRKGFLLLEDAVQEDPALYDAQMGFGLFRYLLAKLPKSMNWVLSMLGFEGDLEGGLHSLRLAAEKGIYTRTEAKLYLAQFLFSESRQDSAIMYLDELRKQYPENTLFIVLYAAWEHRLGNLDEALPAALRAVELNRRKTVRYGEEFAYSTLGSIYLTKNNFHDASAYYRLYFNLTNHQERTPNLTMYRAGLACEISGERDTAIVICRKMREPDGGDRSWDRYYYRKGQDLISHPLTRGEILVVEAGNELTQKNYDRSIEMYRQALGLQEGTIDLGLRCLFGVLQAEFQSGKLSDALETAHQALALKPERETWLIPNTWLTLGQVYAKMGKTTDALSAFKKVGEYDDYDFQGGIERTAKEEEAKLEKLN